MAIELPALPYVKDALVPHISAETLEYHYGKHHQGYVDKLNKLLADGDAQNMELEEIIRSSEGALFNNAAQVWNHTFYWNCLSPNGGGEATGAAGAQIESSFGSFDKFKQAFTESATGNFGSGWTWLVSDLDGGLRVLNTTNAENPLVDPGLTPLLTVDVWEHAYYIDYRNSRPNYMDAFWALVNWEFVNQNIA
jgi:Fe-Mn family superoxide dismutase